MSGGGVVARGKIKVDARRALGKLRDHMLVDGHLYANEIARAAVAIGATRLDVSWDSNDVWIDFDGTPPDMASIARIRDHVLAGEGGDHRLDALRLLGIGVTAALGLDPVFVDVHASDGTSCAQVRFERAYLAEEGAIPQPAPSDRLSRAGMHVHVHHKLGFSTVRRAIGGGAPREVGLLITAVRDAPLTLSLQGDTEKPGPGVVLRIDLDEPSASRAFLEVLVPSREVRATTHVLERGVRLVSYGGVPIWELYDDVPLRLIFDAKKLPTNASRSDIRMDADIWGRAREKLPDAMTRAVQALMAGISGKRLDMAGIEIVDPSPEMHAHALEAIIAGIVLAVRSERPVPEIARDLLDVPIMRDAVGAMLAMRRFATARKETIHTHTGDRPEPAELAPWLGGIPWLRKTPIDRAFNGLALAPADAKIAIARAAYERRARAFQHPPGKPTLPASPGYALQESFAVTEGPFAGLEGCVALVRSDGPYRRSASLRAFVDERLLEAAPLPGVSLPVDIALAWPGHVIARDAYDAVLRNEDLERAVLYALRVAAMAVALRLERRDPEMIRLAAIAWLGATRSLGDVRPSIEGLGPIANDAAWPTSEPGVLVTLKTIVAYAEKTGAICTAPNGSGRAPDGRPVIDASTASALAPLFPPKTVLVPYGDWLAIRPDEVTRALAQGAATMPAFVAINRGDVEGFLGALVPGAVRTLHRGRLVGERKRDVPGLAVLEDRACVPKPGAHFSKGVTLKREDIDLLELVIARVTEDALPLAAVQPYLDAWRTVFANRATSGRGKGRVIATKFLQAIEQLPSLVAERRRTSFKTRFLERPIWAKPAPPPAPHATHAIAGVGEATVFLVSNEHPPIAILAHGRLLGTRTIGVPVGGWVDIAGDDLVLDDWSALNERGVEWSTDALRAASMRLVRDIAANPGFASDESALRLCAMTLEDQSARVLLRDLLGRVRWPTVQGGDRTVGLASSVPAGTTFYATYERGTEHSPYDEPAVHVPKTSLGDVRRRIFEAMGVTLDDVTAAIARLQDRRARGKGAAPAPRLGGEPAHPRLRATLESLGVTSAEGEMEIAETMDVVSIGSNGSATPVVLAVPFAVRCVFRAVDPNVALVELASAAEKLVNAVALKFEPGLPAHATRAIRALACATALQDNAVGKAAVFPDSRGAVLSLVEMKLLGTVRVSFDPTHALPGVGPAGVVLTPEERARLAGVFQFVDVTDAIRAERLGAQRRAGPARSSFELDEDRRARCLVSFPLDPPLKGEAGLLAPDHAALAAIDVYVECCRLTTMTMMQTHAMMGWPTIAIVNDDRLKATPAFDDIADENERTSLLARIRDTSTRYTAAFLRAPDDVLAVVRLPIPFLANRTPCLGVFWLEPQWPESPSVEVTLPGATVVRAPMSPRGLLPIRGRAWVLGTIHELDHSLPVMFEHVRTKLAGLAKTAPEEYRWDVALLDGGDVSVELAKPEPNAALLRVLARRAPHLIVPPKQEIAAVPPMIAHVPPKHVPASESFFQGLSRTVVDLVRTDPPPPVDEDLQRAVRAMKLTGDPVVAIEAAKRGRPIRFEPETGRLVVNTRHPSIRALDRHPSRVFHLLTAAVSEINRELEPVTDAEELAVLRDLLQQS